MFVSALLIVIIIELAVIENRVYKLKKHFIDKQ
jgi:hypothetical protein